MVENELWMHVIVYNLVRAVMPEAALAHGVPGNRISFKGTVSTLRQWATALVIPDPSRGVFLTTNTPGQGSFARNDRGSATPAYAILSPSKGAH